MNCFYHHETKATCTCVGCRKGLCSYCGSISTPPRCADCLIKANEKDRKSFLYTLIVGSFFFLVTAAVLFVAVGSAAFLSPLWWLILIVIATIPWGWRFLHSLFPVFFFSTSIFLFLLYLIFKAALSVFAGIVVMPWQIISAIRLSVQNRTVRKKFEESL